MRSTHHGPVLNADDWRDLQPGELTETRPFDQTVLALKWDAVQQGDSAVAFDALARASGWADFVGALRKFSAPSQNFVYADVDGNIGYAMSGLLPVRSGSNGSVPIDGSQSQGDWRGVVDANLLPAVMNPASGLIVTANNEVSRALPYTITSDWVAPFRAARIGAMLENARGVDIEALKRVQADITSLSADRILGYCRDSG